ncbi:serine/threonine protein kinase [Corallococcus aberystwythensis]|uniref:Serine/threonine protein kinase n=1 Tax=Corallococcus aberystwythensis TaxID=2316722 RepID=A0A3A8PJI3_9BACT|nr:serine/threonine-protein kinase [Corallococcus aberystwythensis]RKH55430.1 serine/threonine protein kinase [Corallococcus aberystwythensis]
MSLEGSQVFPAALQPGAVVGRWRVLGTLGVGGYGAVYRVEPLDAPGRSFALKLSLHPDPARALREMALLLDRAWHPNVVRVHASGRWPDPVEGLPYFVMDCVEGMALHAWAEAFNPTFRQVAMVGGSVAMTLGVLHARGVLHRDLKPEHILIRPREQVPVLIDFGAGDQTGAATLTTTTLPPGTLHLRSPEAIRFQQLHWRQPELRYPYNAADDLYALGVCLYRAVTGHYPFPPEQEPELLAVAITERLPPAPRDINPQVPESLSRAVLRLLAKEPEQRPSTGEAAHAELMRGLLSGGSAAFEAHLFDEIPGTPKQIRRPAWPAQPYLKPAPRAAPVVESPRRRPAWGWLGVAGCLGLLLAGPGTWEVLLRGWTRHTTPEVLETVSAPGGHKLASAPDRPHSVPVAAPATAALVVAPKEEPAPVTTKPPAPPSPKPGRTLKTATIASCMAGMACASAPLVDRPTPPAEDCPQDARAAMSALKIDTIQWAAKFDPTTRSDFVTVREGRTAVYTVGSEGRVRHGSMLTGTLYVGAKRVYGRFTQLRQNKTGETFPVCIELWFLDDMTRGVPRSEGGDENTAVVPNMMSVRSIWRYDE